MLSLILAKKIFSLFIIMLMSMMLVRMKIVKASDSKIMSILLLYLFFPCVILESFQIDFTPEIQHGMLLSTGAAVVVQALLLAMGIFLKNTLHLNAVEQCSVIYSNAGNLIIPLVVAVLGLEWVIYSSSFLAVQLVLFWTYMKSTMARETHIDLKAVFTNANMIAIFIGLVLLSAVFMAIGLLAATFSRSQIVSFILGALSCFVLYWVTLQDHYRSLSRGVVDLRDVVYLLSICAVSVILTTVIIDRLTRK